MSPSMLAPSISLVVDALVAALLRAVFVAVRGHWGKGGRVLRADQGGRRKVYSKQAQLGSGRGGLKRHDGTAAEQRHRGRKATLDTQALACAGWCKHYLEDAHARHCAHATAVLVARSACPTTKPWTRRSGNESGAGDCRRSALLLHAVCSQMCSPPASTCYGCVSAAR